MKCHDNIRAPPLLKPKMYMVFAYETLCKTDLIFHIVCMHDLYYTSREKISITFSKTLHAVVMMCISRHTVVCRAAQEAGAQHP